MIKRLVITFLLLVLLILAGGLFYLYSTTPDYKGEVTSTLVSSETEVIFDDFGVPHIYASTEEDAYFALGYVHAQERLFQMELIRRVATGTLSEIIGADFIRTDQFFRTLGIKEVAKNSAELDFTDPNAPFAKAATAYQNGINAYIAEGKMPPEFTLMGIDLKPFQREDLFNVAAYLALGFAEGFRTDPLLTFIQEKYGEDYLDPFAIHSLPETDVISVYPREAILSDLTNTIDDVISSLPLPLFHGSNSWVVGPDKTESGNVVLANDTHIGYSQPAVWYEAHLSFPGNTIYGHFAAGFPFALLGHTSSIAWGITMLENDDADFYVHPRHPKDSLKIRMDSLWVDMTVSFDTIKIKDEEDVIFPIYRTPIGPVINSSIDNFPSMIQDPVSVHWTFLQSTSPILKAIYQLNHSKSVEDIVQASKLVKAPGLNIMGADDKGNYSYYGAAALDIRDGVPNSKIFQDARVKTPQGYYDASYNPSAINTPWGYVYSANHQPDSVMGVFHAGYFMPEDRAKEIHQFLDSKDKFSFEELANFQLHTRSTNASRVSSQLFLELSRLDLPSEEKETLKLLQDWDGEQKSNSIQPTVYYTLLSEVFHYAMSDELGRKKLDNLTQLAVFKRSLLMFLQYDENLWWDNVKTEEKESKEDILRKAMSHTHKRLTENLGTDRSEWSWGKIHTITHPHVLGSVNLLKNFFNVGPIEIDGGVETVNNTMFPLTHGDKFEVAGGPSMRRVIDMGDIANAKGILPSGQSGHFLSPHYDDQAEMFAKGEFRILMTDKNDIINYSDRKLIFKPDGR